MVRRNSVDSAARGRGAAVPLTQVRPFYQVVVFLASSGHELDLANEITKASSRRRQRESTFTVRGSEAEDQLQYVHVEHTMAPSWVRGPSTFQDLEHDEAILYRKEGYVFLHSNCSALLDLLTTALTDKLERVRAAHIEKVLVLRRAEIRSLGMQNLNAPGRTAPEGKTHFARDAASTLSPVRDAMFGFRYAFAVERDGTGRRAKPFGCSTSKRKVWGTWCEDVDAFIAECDRLVADLDAQDPGQRSWVLASPVADPPDDIEPIAFYADYSVERKGIVWLETHDGTFSADWTCYLSPTGAARFEATTPNGEIIDFELLIERDDRRIVLAYPVGTAARMAKIADDAGALDHRRARDLVELLNDEEAFTVVFSRGLSYRMGEFWKNTGLDEVYGKARKDIDWKGVDIRKESLVPGARNTVGDAILTDLKTLDWPRLSFVTTEQTRSRTIS